MEESNIDAPDDFVVVADKDSAEKETLKRLQTLVELITQALVESASKGSSALSLVTSTEEVRSKYVRNLCSKLVDASAEISKLQEEVESLKTSLERKESEAAEDLKALISATQNIQSVIEKLELSSRGDSLNPPNTPETFQDAVAEPTSMRSLCADLVSICDRLSHLSIQFRSGK
ncbi:hypothetical protein D915_008918 [Fasciola hepatica]|uniref:Uncharacterized protein n=1 Tax=Fasciola hepatica TaxID=6192 RepID=A0A4E0RGS3_FASHE|nr:hypothetical protein D915_008918 [Fasciola hepatica]